MANTIIKQFSLVGCPHHENIIYLTVPPRRLPIASHYQTSNILPCLFILKKSIYKHLLEINPTRLKSNHYFPNEHKHSAYWL